MEWNGMDITVKASKVYGTGVFCVTFSFRCVWSFTAKMIGLPQVFWHEHGIGGGVIQV